MPDEAEVAHLPALTEGLDAFEVNVMQVAVVDDVAAAKHRPEAIQKVALAEFVMVQAFQRLKVIILLGVFGMPYILPALAGAVLEPQRDDPSHDAQKEREFGHLLENPRS